MKETVTELEYIQYYRDLKASDIIQGKYRKLFCPVSNALETVYLASTMIQGKEYYERLRYYAEENIKLREKKALTINGQEITILGVVAIGDEYYYRIKYSDKEKEIYLLEGNFREFVTKPYR